MKRLRIGALLFTSVILTAQLGGCASTSPFGNYVPENVAFDPNGLATDVVSQLVTLYPPARVKLEIQHSTQDLFGIVLVRRLRDRGYALVEFAPKTEGKKDMAPSKASPPELSRENQREPSRESGRDASRDPVKGLFAVSETAPGAIAASTAATTLPLSYVLDQAGTDNLFRLNLIVGAQSISRPYRLQDGRLLPLGMWIRRE